MNNVFRHSAHSRLVKNVCRNEVQKCLATKVLPERSPDRWLPSISKGGVREWLAANPWLRWRKHQTSLGRPTAGDVLHPIIFWLHCDQHFTEDDMVEVRVLLNAGNTFSLHIDKSFSTFLVVIQLSSSDSAQSSTWRTRTSEVGRTLLIYDCKGEEYFLLCLAAFVGTVERCWHSEHLTSRGCDQRG